MFVGVDIGGSKTLLAVLDDNGVIIEKTKVPTNPDYNTFIDQLSDMAAALTNHDFLAAGIAIPGKVNRQTGHGISFGNLPWKDIPMQADAERIFHCPAIVENDANLAGLSEAMLVPEYQKVLYVTISTGIGTGIITNRHIDPLYADSEGGQMLLEYHGKYVPWESFASGHAIVERFGKKAAEISDPEIWKRIAHDLAIGLIDLIAMVEPQIIIIGGSVGVYFERYEKPLLAELKRYETPLVPLPAIHQAVRPEEAVLYGCYDLAKEHYGSIAVA